MSASNYLELKLLEHACGKTSYTMPSSVYLALLTAAPDDTSTGSTITEASYTGYARKAVAGSDWASASAGAIANTNALTFAACTAGSSTVTHFALVDASSAGNVLFWGSLTASLAISAGITPSFAASALSITAD